MAEIKICGNASFPEVELFVPKTFADNRGYFRENFREGDGSRAGLSQAKFVQDNESLSLRPGVVRGLHFQRPPKTQGKVVRVAFGAIFDVVVDLRRRSENFGRWRAFELSSENGAQLYVPHGFAHGFCSLTENTVVSYKVTEFYASECDAGIRWNDPALGIHWPGGLNFIVSEKDAALPPLAELGDIF